MPIGPHLADQLLLPMSLARGGKYIVAEPTLHTTTNIDVIRQFLPVAITLEKLDRGRWQVAIEP